MVPRTLQTERTRRRGTVMILVVGVLAMLFIVGSTLLIVSRFERQTAQLFGNGKNIEAVSLAVTEPIIAQLREDVVGKDGTPYNRSWNTAETSLLEDYADFPGVLAIGANDLQRSIGSGDLLLSSVEPYVTGVNPDTNARIWGQFAASFPLDADLNRANAIRVAAVGLTGRPKGDADGDGIIDSASSSTAGLLSMFGGTYQMDLRVVPNGGMVLFDRLTHPALMAQVIHPQDSAYYLDPTQLFAGTNAVSLGATDEAAIRRRFMLAGSLGSNTDGSTRTADDLPATDIRRKLKITLGYAAPSGSESVLSGFSSAIPHWWPVDGSLVQGDDNWWQLRLMPSDKGLTETGYAESTDLYDRRHLITFFNSDDILRPNRDEIRLSTVTNPALASQLYYVANPDSSASVGSATLPVNAYGVSAGVLAFNTGGLRTAFSLRDVLECVQDASSKEWSEDKPDRRFNQLMAYYLAMLQHTNLGTNDAQLLTAAQLAVNTIDFADADTSSTIGPLNTCVDVQLSGSTVTVCGVEKQPYLTEAYAKIVYPANSDGDAWVTSNVADESIYAVELYNPYDVPLPLDGYIIRTAAGDVALCTSASSFVVKAIPARSSIVIANRFDDPILGTPLFIPGALADSAATGNANFNLFKAPLQIAPGEPVQLVRTGAGLVVLNGSATEVVVDEIAPTTSLLTPGVPQLGDNEWAGPATPGRNPKDNKDRFVRDTSLQRPKEYVDPNPNDRLPPQYWYFTLSRQMLFPLEDYEKDFGSGPIFATDKTRLPVHNLLGSHPLHASALEPVAADVVLPYGHPTNTICDNQWLVWREALGLQLGNTAGAFQPYPVLNPSLGVSWTERSAALAPFPIVTSDRGIDPVTGGCIAFPTTGSLLLVTRHAHLKYVSGGNSRPMTVAATRDADDNLNRNQLMLVDNGHMPVFGTDEKTKDFEDLKGRFDVPWGRLVFDYFTAVPLEELTRLYYLRQAPIGYTSPADSTDTVWQASGTSPARLIDLSDANYRGLYEWLFPYYAPVARATDATSPLGPKVNGRINVNFAPWWVLDGLPVLPDAFSTEADPAVNAIPTNTWGPLAGLPVAELESRRLDPADTPLGQRAGFQFVRHSIDEFYTTSPKSLDNAVTLGKPAKNPPCGLPSISPTLARHIVSYRENRALLNQDGVAVAAFADNGANSVGKPGLVSVGEMCAVLPQVRVPFTTWENPSGGSKQLDTSEKTLSQIRSNQYKTDHNDPSTKIRPYSYVGYLHFLAPLVRMEDWATVKNHVFTVYALIGDPSAGQPIWMRTQVTVDRTRCLYTNDLPERITETAPIGYYNALDD